RRADHSGPRHRLWKDLGAQPGDPQAFESISFLRAAASDRCFAKILYRTMVGRRGLPPAARRAPGRFSRGRALGGPSGRAGAARARCGTHSPCAATVGRYRELPMIVSLWSTILSPALDILLIAFVFYQVLLLIKGTHSVQVVMGLAVLMGMTLLIRHFLKLPAATWL